MIIATMNFLTPEVDHSVIPITCSLALIVWFVIVQTEELKELVLVQTIKENGILTESTRLTMLVLAYVECYSILLSNMNGNQLTEDQTHSVMMIQALILLYQRTSSALPDFIVLKQSAHLVGLSLHGQSLQDLSLPQMF